jgi:hypothetical protein
LLKFHWIPSGIGKNLASAAVLIHSSSFTRRTNAVLHAFGAINLPSGCVPPALFDSNVPTMRFGRVSHTECGAVSAKMIANKFSGAWKPVIFLVPQVPDSELLDKQ